MNTSFWSLCLHRLNVLCCLGLLALGPFLHAHLGHANTEGFHLDGLQWHSHAQDSDSLSFTADDEHDAPAVGVTPSVTREAHDAPLAHDLIAWSCTVLLMVVPLLLGAAWMKPVFATSRRPLAYTAGYPPPALAPPYPA